MLADFINGGGSRQPLPAPFGKRTTDVSHEFTQWDYLQPGSTPQWRPAKGTRTTRFHKGFQRRYQGDIGQDRARKEFEAKRAERTANVEHARREYLNTRDKANGFNVITGKQFQGMRSAATHHPQKKHFDEGSLVTPFLRREGDVLLRTSDSRFHRPEIVTTKRRTQRIKDEGLQTTVKYSSVLGIGRADMKSYGVADNFSKSLYPWNRPATTAASQRPPRQASGRAVRSAGGQSGVLSGTARSVLGSARSAKAPKDPELYVGRNGGGLGRGDDAGSGGGGGVNANTSVRSTARSVHSAVSRASVYSRGSLRSAAARSFREQQSRRADIDFVRALPE